MILVKFRTLREYQTKAININATFTKRKRFISILLCRIYLIIVSNCVCFEYYPRYVPYQTVKLTWLCKFKIFYFYEIQDQLSRESYGPNNYINMIRGNIIFLKISIDLTLVLCLFASIYKYKNIQPSETFSELSEMRSNNNKNSVNSKYTHKPTAKTPRSEINIILSCSENSVILYLYITFFFSFFPSFYYYVRSSVTEILATVHAWVA